MAASLFTPFQLGDLVLANRMVMAPMTRNRAEKAGAVPPLMVTYYQQRATAGLIITESTTVSPLGVGYPFTPGIYDDAQAMSWLRVTDAVHSAGGRIFAQLQHCGRVSHPSLLPEGAWPVAPSALRPSGDAVTLTGHQPFVTPRELTTPEIADVVAQFRDAGARARLAGFDGVEIHGANGYLIDQFLRDGSNHRADEYGGNVMNRMRLLNEVLDAVCGVWPADRVGLRLTPENRFNSMSDSDPQRHFGAIVEQLSGRGLAYLHVLEGDMQTRAVTVDYRALRKRFSGPYVANNGYDLSRARQKLYEGDADLIAFGVPFLANPDLVRRYREGLPLNAADASTFYGGGENGYTDYPFYQSPFPGLTRSEGAGERSDYAR
jgi:N-ethylmaleimide reductase